VWLVVRRRYRAGCSGSIGCHGRAPALHEGLRIPLLRAPARRQDQAFELTDACWRMIEVAHTCHGAHDAGNLGATMIWWAIRLRQSLLRLALFAARHLHRRLGISSGGNCRRMHRAGRTSVRCASQRRRSDHEWVCRRDAIVMTAGGQVQIVRH